MRMRQISKLLVVFIFVLSIMTQNVSAAYDHGAVTITDNGGYYKICINMNKNITHKQAGMELGKKILARIPNYEALWDSYLFDIAGKTEVYAEFLRRVEEIRPALDQAYRDEIDGIASQLTGAGQNTMNDGKLSRDELYILNLFPDIGRSTQCSAFSVYGKRSEKGKMMTARILDWYAGSQNQLAKLQAVLVIKNKNKSICTIGYVGYMGVISGFNKKGVFGAILDSSTKMPFSITGRRSYTMDLRHALENARNTDEAANYLKNPEYKYTFGHLIFLSDKKASKVLENNISDTAQCIRDVRTSSSVLNDGIEWGITDSVGTVNSFMLKGNFDNFTPNIINTARWASMKNQILSKGNKVNLAEMKEIISFNNGDGPGNQSDGDLYNSRTQQIMIFEPANLHLEIFFRPIDGKLPNVPVFKKVRVNF